MDARSCLCERLPKELAAKLAGLDRKSADGLQEIRVYADGQTEFVIGGAAREIPVHVRMQELLAALSAQALYSCETQMAQGYIPLPGGHRAGVCGVMVRQQDGTWCMVDVSSVCIRVSHDIPHASRAIRPYLVDDVHVPQRVLLLGAPGCGKTTVLRDAAIYLAQSGLHVAVADEREELFARRMYDTPKRLDVLGGVEKAMAMPMLIRSMAPQVVVTDEIGKHEDVPALLDAVRCGVGLIASAHARSMAEAKRRPALRQLMEEEAFDWYILLGRYGSVAGVYDRAGEQEKEWRRIQDGQLGCGGDGDDCIKRDRLPAIGW